MSPSDVPATEAAGHSVNVTGGVAINGYDAVA
jgi:hypothetical protein